MSCPKIFRVDNTESVITADNTESVINSGENETEESEEVTKEAQLTTGEGTSVCILLDKV